MEENGLNEALASVPIDCRACKLGSQHHLLTRQTDVM
jgi:hypothetical protein